MCKLNAKSRAKFASLNAPLVRERESTGFVTLSMNIRYLGLIKNLKIKLICPIGLHHPLDGVTNPEYKLLHVIQVTIFFAKIRGHLLLTGIGAAI
jgi:hypothetical protein